MAKQAFQKINIAFLPPQEISAQVIAFGKLLPQDSLDLELDGERMPHVTIYYTEFPVKNIAAIIKKVGQICSQIHPVRFRFKKLSFPYSYYFVLFHRTARLQRIHMRILRAVNPLREGHLRLKYRPGSPEMKKLTPKEQTAGSLYGHINAGANYHPHISLAKYKDDTSVKLVDLPKFSLHTFSSETVIIFTGSRSGQANKILARFILK